MMKKVKKDIIMDLKLAVNAISDLWIQNGSGIYLYNGKLWHSGLIDFQALNLKDKKVVWFTKDSKRQDYYNGWAKKDAERHQKNAYKSELESKNNLRLANFNQDHFLEITANYLERDHGNLNTALYIFCLEKEIDGIIRGDDLNEIAITTNQIPNLHFLNKIDLYIREQK